jgi:hypothetical protein
VPKRLLTLAIAAALLAGACGKIPQGTVTTQGVTFIPEVVDAVDNAGLGNQVVVDTGGVPYMSYLIFPAVLPAGAIPIARPIGAPYIKVPPSGSVPEQDGAAVGVASLAANGIWTRGAAAQVRDTPPGIVIPYGPATETSLIGATADNTNGTSIALDGSGGIHVAWTGDDGVYYAEAPSTGGFTAEKIYKFGSKLAVVGPISRPSIAVDASGTPWIAYSVLSDRLQVDVATKDASGTWVTSTVSTSGACNGCPPPRGTRIGITPDGPIVTWFDPSSSSIMAARSKGGVWTTETVASKVQADGLDLAVGKDGTVFISYYTASAVSIASSVPGGWTIAKVADVTASPSPTATPTPTPSPAAPTASATPTASPTPPPPPLPEPTAGNFEPTTGVAVDGTGKVYLTWYDGATDSVMLDSGDGTTFTSVQTQDTQGGAYPSVAVAPDGSKVFVTWYAEAGSAGSGQDLRLGIEGEDASSLAVAAPSPTPSVSISTGPTGCGQDGKIALSEVAKGTAFQDTCLVAPAGQSFSIAFDDQDVASVIGQHNIAISTDSAGANLIFTGALVTGPAKVTYDVTKDSGPLKAGTYYFHCQVHPVMQGELVVVKAK